MSGAAALTAFWNTVTGNVWVGPAGTSVSESSIDDAIPCSSEVFDELRAYDAVVAAGFSRRANWLIVPGVPHLRSLVVTPAV